MAHTVWLSSIQELYLSVRNFIRADHQCVYGSTNTAQYATQSSI